MSIVFKEQQLSEIPGDVSISGTEEGASFTRDGYLWICRNGKFWSCEDTGESREFLNMIFHEINNSSDNINNRLKNILDGKSQYEPACEIADIGIKTPESSYIIVLRTKENRFDAVTKTIRPLAPIENRDLIIEYSDRDTVLIKEGSDFREICEFVYALLDTLETEVGLKLSAGISLMQTCINDWETGFRQANTALAVSEAFRIEGSVHAYSDLFLERLLFALPKKFRDELLKESVSNEYDKVFNKDTLETAEAFFGSDLNLSDTARQMFIHRNTLTYRLEKIKKETGFDLRKFKDAVAFKSIMTLAAPESEKRNEQ